MANNTFSSPGAAASRAILELMRAREVEKRQALLDSFDVDGRLRQRAREDNATRRQAEQDAQTKADRLSQIVGPDADLTAGQAGDLRAGGYNVTDRNTIAARSLSNEAAPGVSVGSHELPAAPYSRRAETYNEQLARQQREAAQAERDQTRKFRDEQAQADRAFKGDQADANRDARAEQSKSDRELKLLIAGMSQSQSAETRALGNQLQQLHISAEQDKLDAGRKERDQTTKARTQARRELRDLAQGLMDDPALSQITGYIDARTPDVRPSSIDARKRLEQLVNKLSLEGRGQLKGQGAVSDFEGRMLAGAVSAIDPAAGADVVKRHLKSIVGIMSDDEPGGSGSGNGGVVRWGRDANGRPVRLQ